METERNRANRPIADQSRVVGEEVSRLGRVTRDEARDQLETAKESALDMVDRGRSAAESWERRAETAIYDRPFRATAIAAVAGVALGLLLSRGWGSR